MILGNAKKIVLIAHDNRKDDLLSWARFNKVILSRHRLWGSGTTGRLVREKTGLDVELFKSGPLGGDLQAGAAVAEGKIDLLIFFWDPLEPLPHDPDIKALLRVAVMYNIPVAMNRATADFLISSRIMEEEYDNETTEESIKDSVELNKKLKQNFISR